MSETPKLDPIAEQAERRRPLHVRDWREKLDGFLQFNEREVLKNAGRISMEIAQKLATDRYEEFNTARLSEDTGEPDELTALAKRLGSKKKDASS